MSQTGIVEKVDVLARSNWKNYRFQIDGVWYGAFATEENEASLKEPQEGDKVEFEWKQKGKYKNILSISVVEKGAVKPEALPQASGGWSAEKDYRITYMASQKVAADLVDVMLREGAIALGNKQAATKYDVVMAAFEEISKTVAKAAWAARVDNNNEEEQEYVE